MLIPYFLNALPQNTYISSTFVTFIMGKGPLLHWYDIYKFISLFQIFFSILVLNPLLHSVAQEQHLTEISILK